MYTFIEQKRRSFNLLFIGAVFQKVYNRDIFLSFNLLFIGACIGSVIVVNTVVCFQSPFHRSAKFVDCERLRVLVLSISFSSEPLLAVFGGYIGTIFQSPFHRSGYLK